MEVAQLTAETATAEHLVNAADRVLYRSKRTGLLNAGRAVADNGTLGGLEVSCASS